MKKILLTLILGIFLISLTSGILTDLGTFQRNTDINLIQICGTCTFNNISAVLYPNSTIAISNVGMTRDGSYYNFTLDANFTQDLGTYIVNGVGDLDGTNTSWNYNFEITNTGRTFDEGQGIVSVGILFGTLILCFFFLWVGSKLMVEPGTVPLGFFFSVFSLIFAVYALNLSYAFTNDILQYESLIPVTSTIYIVVLWSLTGFAIISAALMFIAFVKELSRTVQRKKMGDDFDPITDTYKLDSKF